MTKLRRIAHREAELQRRLLRFSNLKDDRSDVQQLKAEALKNLINKNYVVAAECLEILEDMIGEDAMQGIADFQYYRLTRTGLTVGFKRVSVDGIVEFAPLGKNKWQTEPIDYDDKMALAKNPFVIWQGDGR